MKKLFYILICAIGFAVCAPATDSRFVASNSSIFIKDATAAFDLYQGGWVGRQSIMLGGKLLLESFVEQRYMETSAENGERRLLGIGKITTQNESVETHCYLYLENGGNTLRLEVSQNDDTIFIYKGIVEKNTILWTPYFKFMNFDIMRDEFFSNDRGMILSSVGAKYVEIRSQNFRGIISSNSFMQKDSGNFNMKEVKTISTVSFINDEK